MTVQQLIELLQQQPADMEVCCHSHDVIVECTKLDYDSRVVTLRQGYFVGSDQPGVREGFFVNAEKALSTNTSNGEPFLNLTSPHIHPVVRLEGVGR